VGGATPASKLGVAEVGEGPRAEEAEVVAAGGDGQGAELAASVRGEVGDFF